MELLSKTYSVERYFLYDDGIFPNNPEFPVLVYRNVLRLPEFFPAHFVRNLFADHHWDNSWKDGIDCPACRGRPSACKCILRIRTWVASTTLAVWALIPKDVTMT
jgi:hypothetical protein